MRYVIYVGDEETISKENVFWEVAALVEDMISSDEEI